MEFETVIGLEVHVQLKTQTKAFCGCSTVFGSQPNTHTCPVCLGFPGSLPVLNEKALTYAVKVALALQCSVQSYIKFDRKNYFYPDLPKNYQISQYDMPVGLDGCVECESPDGAKKKIRVKRVHLEEDAGKLIHKPEASCSLVDYNRCGMPLLEIVSQPDIRSPQEAYDYLKELKLILQYLDVSDCDMEKGSLRCDANISLRPMGQQELGTKTELKNMNSLRWVKAALEFEQKRQAEILSEKKTISQETRLWDEEKQATYSMRSKEEAHDYRYFPDPDLVPFTLQEEFVKEVRESIPELPQQKKVRFVRELGLNATEADIIIQDKELCRLFEECVKDLPEPKKVYNLLSGSVLNYVSANNKTVGCVLPRFRELNQIIRYIDNGTLSNLAAKQVLFVMLDAQKDIDSVIQEKGLSQVSDEGELEHFVAVVLKEHQKTADDYLSGKENALMFLIGQTMKLSKGKANPKVVRELLLRRLKK